ncbi:MAG: hypothetical protein V4722_13330 [Bacteroidota bacterium]
MLRFKKIDFWISVISIFVFAVLSLINQDETFIAGYFTVGTWQVISMLVHQVNGWFTSKGSRRHYYHLVTLVTVVLMVATPLLYITGFIFFILIFTAPIMAVYYASICFRELALLEAKALVHLKD